MYVHHTWWWCMQNEITILWLSTIPAVFLLLIFFTIFTINWSSFELFFNLIWYHFLEHVWSSILGLTIWYNMAAPQGRYFVQNLPSLYNQLRNGIWPWTEGIRGRLPLHYKKRYVERFMRKPIPVHYVPSSQKFTPDSMGTLWAYSLVLYHLWCDIKMFLLVSAK